MSMYEKALRTKSGVAHPVSCRVIVIHLMSSFTENYRRDSGMRGQDAHDAGIAASKPRWIVQELRTILLV